MIDRLVFNHAPVRITCSYINLSFHGSSVSSFDLRQPVVSVLNSQPATSISCYFFALPHIIYTVIGNDINHVIHSEVSNDQLYNRHRYMLFLVLIVQWWVYGITITQATVLNPRVNHKLLEFVGRPTYDEGLQVLLPNFDNLYLP